MCHAQTMGVKCGNFGTPARLLIELAWARLGSLGKIQRNSKFRQRIVKGISARSLGWASLVNICARSLGWAVIVNLPARLGSPGLAWQNTKE